MGARGAEPARRSNRDVERYALYSLGWARALSGRPIDDLCARSGAAADPGSYIAASPERIAGQRHVWRGELDAARAILAPLLALADERGEPASYALCASISPSSSCARARGRRRGAGSTSGPSRARASC